MHFWSSALSEALRRKATDNFHPRLYRSEPPRFVFPDYPEGFAPAVVSPECHPMPESDRADSPAPTVGGRRLRDVAKAPSRAASNSARLKNHIFSALGTRFNPAGNRLSYDFSRRRGEKESLGEGGSPLDSGEGRIGKTLTV